MYIYIHVGGGLTKKNFLSNSSNVLNLAIPEYSRKILGMGITLIVLEGFGLGLGLETIIRVRKRIILIRFRCFFDQ